MKTNTVILAILIASSLMTLIDADEGKKHSTYVSQERLLDSLVQAKWRDLLLSKYKESLEESQKHKVNQFKQESDEDTHGRTFVRRKLVGISDNPF